MILSIEILKVIRDEVRGTNGRLEVLRVDLDNLRTDLSTRIDLTNDRLDHLARRQTETEVRLSTELVAVAGAVHEVRDLLREDRALRERVEDHERRLTAIETRAG